MTKLVQNRTFWEQRMVNQLHNVTVCAMVDSYIRALLSYSYLKLMKSITEIYSSKKKEKV